MGSGRYSRRAALPSPRLTRVTRRIAGLQGQSNALGVPIMCPIEYCNTLVPPSFAHDGTIEYRCYVGNHGRIGKVVNGCVELTVRTVVSPRRRVYPSRPKCLSPGCTLPRNSTCGRSYCLRHCLDKKNKCGGYKHDYARALEDMHAMHANRRLESIEVHPGTPLFFPSTPSPAPSPALPRSSPPPSSPVPGVDYDPGAADVQLVFLDRSLTVEAICVVEYDYVDLKAQSLPVREALLTHQIRTGTLEYLAADGEWYATAGRAVPVRYGRLCMRAESVDRIFPPAHYVDMAPRIERYSRLVDRNVPADTAFETVFGCEPTAADFESLDLGRRALEQSPRHLCDKFDAAGRSSAGTWSGFVHTCFDLHGDPAPSSPTDGASSPSYTRSRPAWRGPPSSEAGSSCSYNQNASPPPIIIDSDSE